MNKGSSESLSFEFIDRETGSSSSKKQRDELASSLSSGNLLSNVAPPASIPDFSLYTEPSPGQPTTAPKPTTPAPPISVPNLATTPLISSEQYPTSQFSAAIPPSKGIPQGVKSQQTTESKSERNEESSGFMNMVRGALNSEMLHKVAEKAKHSVDTLITTLDPQMSEYIHSGGDTEIIVISENEDDIATIREAIHSVLGKAWVNGTKPTQTSKIQSFELRDGIKNAEGKISQIASMNKPAIAIDEVIFDINGWFYTIVLVFKDAEKQINVHTLSQAIPLPLDILREIEGNALYEKLNTAQKLATYIEENPYWLELVSGVKRKNILHLAARTLISAYKNKLYSPT